MKRTLFAASIALTILAAAFFVAPSSSAGDLTKSKSAVTFNKDVAPILFKSCAECHRPGEAAPMSLLSYKEARPWARSIREKVVSREMPPWHADPRVGQFSNDPRMTQAEIDTITAWVDGGSKEGEPRDLPPAPKFVDGWSIGQPDFILKMPEEFTLDANGPDEYQHFVIDPGFTEDKYVQVAEARPGNRRIVHHIIAVIMAPPKDGQPQKNLTIEEFEKMRAERDPILYKEGFLRRLKPDVPVYDDGCQLPNGGGGNQFDGSGQFRFGMVLCGFAPGREPTNWEPGMVKKIPAGSKILLQVHYSKTAGQVEKDRSMIGMVFAKQPPRKELFTYPIQNRYFRIPPGAENHRVTACWTAPQDIHLTGARPHMHKRGKAMEIKVFYPNGRSEVLLNVPRYDFSWQTLYNFKQSIAIPKGTRFMVTGYLDNSVKNKHNPDPAQAVRFGEPTYDEMMIGWIEYTVDSQSLKPAATQSAGGATQKLLAAIRDADAQTVRAFLSDGADVNARDEDGMTALMYAAMYADADCVKLLLAQGADPNARSKSGASALMLAIGKADKVRLLLSKGAEVNAKSKQGHTALTIAAARAGSAEVVKALLDHGADLTNANVLGAAARSGDIQVVKLLLERGAEPNGKNQIGGPPPVLVKRAGDLNQTGGTPVISPLLLVLTGTIGSTPLMYAAQARNAEVAKLLSAKGANANARNIVNVTALILAAQLGDPATVKLLLEKGAEVNARHESGYIALMYAAASESNDPELIKALLASGADLNVKANDGETALKLAGRKGRTAIVRLLEKAGAKE